MQGRTRLELALRAREPTRAGSDAPRQQPRPAAGLSSHPPQNRPPAAAEPTARPTPAPLRAPASSARDPRVRWRSYAAATLGFLAGIVFWHFIGFWGFVSEVVFKGDRVTPIAEADRTAPPGTERRKLQTTIYGGIPSADLAGTGTCTLLRLDRNNGRTMAVPCEEAVPAPIAATAQRRLSSTPESPPQHAAPVPSTPRVPSVAGWATTVRQMTADPQRRDAYSPAPAAR
jgi:hypothetical protein